MKLQNRPPRYQKRPQNQLSKRQNYSSYAPDNQHWRGLAIEIGLVKFDHIPADGKFHGVPTEAHPRKLNGRILRRFDGSGLAWNFETGQHVEWQPGRRTSLLATKNQQQVSKEQRRREAEQTAKYEATANLAVGIWTESKPAPVSHPYLLRKGIQPNGAHIGNADNGSRLIIPIHNTSRRLQSLQFISPDGSKRFLFGGKLKGGRFRIGDEPKSDETILICEGYATASTIFQETGYVTFAAFSAANLRPVACSIRAQYPNAEIIIAGDNDHETEKRIGKNPGASAACKAAAACGGLFAIPPELPGCSDWNDYCRLSGKKAAI